MAMFHVNVTETSSGFIEIEADTEEEAISKATDIFHSGDVNWDDTVFGVVSVVEILGVN